MKRIKMSEGLKLYNETENAVLIDVRNEEEYLSGRIPRSINIPLSRIDSIEDDCFDYDKPVFVYCLSGGRSARAAARLSRLGYEKVYDLGGISAYKGELEK